MAIHSSKFDDSISDSLHAANPGSGFGAGAGIHWAARLDSCFRRNDNFSVTCIRIAKFRIRFMACMTCNFLSLTGIFVKFGF